MKCLHLYVHGIVQGVGFRRYTKKVALKHQLKGWVRNTPDGKVEIQAMGVERNLNDFLSSIRKGSKRSTVDHIEIHHINDVKPNQFFTIIRK